MVIITRVRNIDFLHSYIEYKSKKWGLKFTYPADLEVKESSKAPEILFEKIK